jgi:hypothetical protein
MKPERNEDEKLRRFVEQGNLYESAELIVGGMLTREYSMPESAVDSVLLDVFSEYRMVEGRVALPLPWLVDVACHVAARSLHARGLLGSRRPEDEVRRMRTILFAQQALATLPDQARRAITLLFDGEERSYADIAEELEVTAYYAESLVAKGLALLLKWQEMNEQDLQQQR